MENSILSRLPFDPVIIIVILVICIVVLFVILASVISTQKKLLAHYRKFMRGKDGRSMESALLACFDDMDQTDMILKKHEKAIMNIGQRETSNFQKMGLVKYDAFQEMGGKLSFALTLLDKKDNGFILNAIHSREGCYEYIKEIVNGESFVALSDEEAESLNKALSSGEI